MAKANVTETPDVFPVVITDAQSRKIDDLARAWGVSKQFLVDSLHNNRERLTGELSSVEIAEYLNVLLDAAHELVRMFPRAWPNGIMMQESADGAMA